jgi:serine/threonine protein kinase
MAKCSPNDPNYYHELYTAIKTKPLKFRSGVVLSYDIKALLRKMLDKDPDRRPDICDVLTHSWTLPPPYRSLAPTSLSTSRLSVSSNIPSDNNKENHVVIPDTNDSRLENESRLKPHKRILTLRLRRKTRSLSNCEGTRRSL